MRLHGELRSPAFLAHRISSNPLNGARNSAFSENFRAGSVVGFRPNLDSKIESHVTMV
jgi:hypothetical protein